MISVISPSFNQSRFLEFCIHSVSSQRIPGELEHLVLDGGSTDGSLNLLQEHAHHLDYFHSQADDGQSDAINTGMSMARGELLCWINSDDGLAPQAVSAMASAMADPTKPAWAIGQCLVIDERGDHLRTWNPTRHDNLDFVLNWRDNYVMQPAVFWTRSMWEAAGPLRTDYHYAMDFDLWIRFFKICKPILVNQPIGIHRVHGQSKTSLVGVRIFDEYLRILDDRLSDDPTRRKKGLRDVAHSLCWRANAEIFHGNIPLSRTLAAKAFSAAPSAAIADISFWKALVKLSMRAARRIISLSRSD
jgi:GT2 family glycosyltransferase